MRVVARAQMSAALLLGLATAGPVAAQQFNQFVVFGDSTVDSGFYRTFTNRVAADSATHSGPLPSRRAQESRPPARG